MIDDLKLLKGTGETTIVPSSEIIAGDGYYYHHDIKRLFLYHVENFDYTLNDLDEVTNSDIEELVLCACP
ncbi:MAG: hypothetical protein LBP31_01670, partial [Holosporales bacterium]|nr:hypothetical protein [Holosporales bacterium]